MNQHLAYTCTFCRVAVIQAWRNISYCYINNNCPQTVDFENTHPQAPTSWLTTALTEQNAQHTIIVMALGIERSCISIPLVPTCHSLGCGPIGWRLSETDAAVAVGHPLALSPHQQSVLLLDH